MPDTYQVTTVESAATVLSSCPPLWLFVDCPKAPGLGEASEVCTLMRKFSKCLSYQTLNPCLVPDYPQQSCMWLLFFFFFLLLGIGPQENSVS